MRQPLVGAPCMAKGVICFCGEKGITFSDPGGGFPATPEQTLSGFLIIFLQLLQKASFLRIFINIINPAIGGVCSGIAERKGFEPPVPF